MGLYTLVTIAGTGHVAREVVPSTLTSNFRLASTLRTTVTPVLKTVSWVIVLQDTVWGFFAPHALGNSTPVCVRDRVDDMADFCTLHTSDRVSAEVANSKFYPAFLTGNKFTARLTTAFS